ncbi:MAG: ATP-binding protein [Candidatus Margulisiibacteriota bacterium]
MVNRFCRPLLSNSFFIFGARGTGKTTFLKSLFKGKSILWIDLLDPEEEDRFHRTPNELARRVEANPHLEWVVIDEIQKNPALLNVIHHLIETTSIKFALTGSSARKLKQGSANLLAGRAFYNHFYPLTYFEMKDAFELDDVLSWGTLPKLLGTHSTREKTEYLKTYALTYLREEIWSEHIIRKLDPFRKFLEVAAQCNGEILNYANIARDVGVATTTVQSYFEILDETLLGHFLEPYHQSIRKQQRQNPKFFLFDTGVKRALEGQLSVSLVPGTYDYGHAFEQFIVLEIMRLNDYLGMDLKLSYLRTKDQAEIDLIIEYPNGETLLIEIKSTEEVDERHIRTLNRFLPDFENARGMLISRDPYPKKIGAVMAYPWQAALKEIFRFTKEGLLKTLEEKGFRRNQNQGFTHPKTQTTLTMEVMNYFPQDVDLVELDLDAENTIYSMAPLEKTPAGFINCVVGLS